MSVHHDNGDGNRNNHMNSCIIVVFSVLYTEVREKAYKPDALNYPKPTPKTDPKQTLSHKP